MTPDAIIEEAVLPGFRQTYEHNPRAIELCVFRREWGLLNHKARADLAMISAANFLHLVEVKGQDDDCRRLAGQVATYSKVGHYCHLYAVPKLAKEALSIVPSWWGVVSVGIAGTAVLQQARVNPDLKTKDVLGLLWVDELRELARTCGMKVSGRKKELIERLDTGPQRAFVAEVMTVIRNRKDGDGARPFFAPL